MSRLGYCKYMSSSHLNWSDTLAVPAFLPNVKDEAEPEPNIKLNFPFSLVPVSYPVIVFYQLVNFISITISLNFIHQLHHWFTSMLNLHLKWEFRKAHVSNNKTHCFISVLVLRSCLIRSFNLTVKGVSVAFRATFLLLITSISGLIAEHQRRLETRMWADRLNALPFIVTKTRWNLNQMI